MPQSQKANKIQETRPESESGIEDQVLSSKSDKKEDETEAMAKMKKYLLSKTK